MRRWGGARQDWLDLSTGINPVPYPLPDFTPDDWAALPGSAAEAELISAARRFWDVPDTLDILAAPGASSLIAQMPGLFARGSVDIPKPTYNEHAAAFAAQGWQEAEGAALRVLVHPNNPTGHYWSAADLSAEFTIIDESFCDVAPERSLISEARSGRCLVLKSFGKFWGLAGLRLGFAIAAPEIIAKLRDVIGPWAVSGPALRVGALALSDPAWAAETRNRLAQDAARLDALMVQNGAAPRGGCGLFQLYEVDDAAAWQDRLGRAYILSRIFPYSDRYLRLGLPSAAGWDRLTTALGG
ncbi:pyridoxal phosphate-dependent class II aminotransferase [Cognatishimia sp. SS12]|uniref:threonine-phosphate decarboxylase n=1 Tax=Cognatishimia sp. SS12 TaxID=2979465 RepID=UPI00232D3602|nr:threonine-phosphate decarboxylase [Cognatishimia sp. SS12]MDC0739246.1 pyridoxal phosphate-dependent class II aminotransferase [Cognatishimia sp. SS12]